MGTMSAIGSVEQCCRLLDLLLSIREVANFPSVTTEYPSDHFHSKAPCD